MLLDGNTALIDEVARANPEVSRDAVHYYTYANHLVTNGRVYTGLVHLVVLFTHDTAALRRVRKMYGTIQELQESDAPPTDPLTMHV
jgi:hypothetical protein